jgi:hypothetical protein
MKTTMGKFNNVFVCVSQKEKKIGKALNGNQNYL